MSTSIGHITRQQPCLSGFVPSPSPNPSVESSNSGDDDGYNAFGSTHDEDMTVSQWFTLCHLWQKRGSGFGYEKVVLLLGGELD